MIVLLSIRDILSGIVLRFWDPQRGKALAKQRVWQKSLRWGSCEERLGELGQPGAGMAFGDLTAAPSAYREVIEERARLYRAVQSKRAVGMSSSKKSSLGLSRNLFCVRTVRQRHGLPGDVLQSPSLGF